MAENKTTPLKRPIARAGVLLSACLLLWAFPPFHVVKTTHAPNGVNVPSTGQVFDAKAAAKKMWFSDMPAGTNKASALLEVAKAVQANATQARAQYGKQSGLGATYFLTQGKGRVIAREGSRVRLALDESSTQIVELRLGPVFGNTVRDGCGLLDVNAFPGLQEFNALSAELNALVEKEVLPALREKAIVGATISFTACAEAPETPPAVGAPLLILIPIQAEVR